MEKPYFLRTDCQSILSKIKHEEKQIQLKRRWLLGLPISEAELNQSKRPKILDTRSLPESFLREDDIFYDTVKSCVEEAFGVRRSVTGNEDVKDDLQLAYMPNMTKVILSCIDDLSNKGLYLLAMILTEGRVKFEKTRWKMKKVVRESVLAVLGSKDHHHHHLIGISGQLTQLFSDPLNFRDNRVSSLTSRSLIQRAAATEVLHGLKKFSCQTLIAMYKKLKGLQPNPPQLQPCRTGWSREYLIKQVKKTSKRILFLGEGDQLPEPLSKAMAVAGLSLKLIPGFHNSSLTEFCQFSPETKVLQNELVKAIWIVKLKTKIGITELKNIKNLLDPNAKVSNRCLRTAVGKMLIQYLFECSNMDMIPKSLLETLSIINKNSRSIPDGFILKDAIDEEVESILNVSAHAKQIFWDYLPGRDFDVDFTDAYMEDLEESDDDYGYVDDERGQDDDSSSQNDSSHSVGSNHDVESSGESVPFNVKRPTATTTAEDACPLTPDERPNNAFVNGLEAEFSTGVHTAHFSFGEAKEMNDEQTTYKNQYLAIQEVCDETSMIAYNLIGHMLEEFGHKEGLDMDCFCSFYLRGHCANKEDSQVAVEADASAKESDGETVARVTKELLPAFPKSGIEKLGKLMGL
ncbi:hypothetical protein PanWU01x14_024710 [Parasponia andersonii]|uniref:Uncharacterized protein n=1 Tax=Parasponia andersonii TaxID=3476 RepID=A0A2P5DWP7_PARAD|nr:hypothetical protein PanWU01x14_024710 [Parasponia andersonii]